MLALLSKVLAWHEGPIGCEGVAMSVKAQGLVLLPVAPALPLIARTICSLSGPPSVSSVTCLTVKVLPLVWCVALACFRRRRRRRVV